ncbi:MAG: hypothetical protein DMF66_16530 [Acidobacteria bacterium]|nr:MAG: hypothetical protein DMF66_16530 [Acidobacteriota bacterium]
MKVQTRLFLLLVLALLCSSLITCKRHQSPPVLEAVDPIDRRSDLPVGAPISRDLDEIKRGGTLTVLAPYNSTTYFVYRGEPFGYEYELLQSFARDQGLTLKMVVVTDLKSIYSMLNRGEGDVDDAQRLAEKYGGNPKSWEDVSYWLLQESTQQYIADPVVKFGFCRGLEPVIYVTFILKRFDHYKQFVVGQ